MSSARSRRLALALAPALALASALGAVSGCDRIGDQVCDEGTNPNELGDQCPFGPPGGPKIHEEGCPPVPQITEGCEVSFRDDVWPALTKLAPGEQNCASAACHGAGAGAITLPEGDPAKSFSVLKSYAPQEGYPYLSDETPAHTWLLCNLAGTKGGRSPMPPAPSFPIAEATYQLVEKWAQCGQRLDKSGGGAGGSGGGGGAGGAGG